MSGSAYLLIHQAHNSLCSSSSACSECASQAAGERVQPQVGRAIGEIGRNRSGFARFNEYLRQVLLNVLTTTIGRFLKHLATASIVKETSPGVYAPNATTEILATPAAAGAFINK